MLIAGTNRTATFPDASGTVALAGAGGGILLEYLNGTIWRLEQLLNYGTNDVISMQATGETWNSWCWCCE